MIFNEFVEEVAHIVGGFLDAVSDVLISDCISKVFVKHLLDECIAIEDRNSHIFLCFNDD